MKYLVSIFFIVAVFFFSCSSSEIVKCIVYKDLNYLHLTYFSDEIPDDGKTNYSLLYYKDDRPVKRKDYDADGDLVFIYRFKYNNGKIVKSYKYNEDDKLLFYKVYKYKKDNIIAVSIYNPKHKRVRLISYNLNSFKKEKDKKLVSKKKK